MHEYSIIHALVGSVRASVERTAGTAGSTVKHVRIEIGSLAGVDLELLATAFEVFREGTICAQATLEITAVEAQWACPRCEQILARGAVLHCSTCDIPATLTRGDEIVLAQVELAVPDPEDAFMKKGDDHVSGLRMW